MNLYAVIQGDLKVALSDCKVKKEWSDNYGNQCHLGIWGFMNVLAPLFKCTDLPYLHISLRVVYYTFDLLMHLEGKPKQFSLLRTGGLCGSVT